MPVELYRKRPVIVSALQWKGNNGGAIQEWIGYAPHTTRHGPGYGFVALGTERADQLFGQLGNETPDVDEMATKHRLMWDNGQTAAIWVAANDSWLGIETSEWIIHDTKGFYPCKADVFEMTYEPVYETLAEREAKVTSLFRDVPLPDHPDDGPGERLARVIILAREKKGMSRYDLHKRSGVGYPYLSEIEKGHWPTMNTLQLLSAILDMSVEDLIGATGVAESPEAP